MISSLLPGQIVRTHRFTLGVPGQFAVARGGSAVLFLRGRTGHDPVTCLWSLDLDGGRERLLADPAKLLEPANPLGGRARAPAETDHARHERPVKQASGIGGYATDRAGRLAVFALADGLWTVDLAGGRVRRLPAKCPVADPRPDPTGQRIAYVHVDGLRVIEADGTQDRAIVMPDGPDVTFGVARQAGIVSLQGSRGYWWAPDGSRLLVARTDHAGVGLWHVTDPAGPETPPHTVRYAAAGTANAEVTLWITGLDGSRRQARWDRDAFEYVPRAGWDAHGPYALVQSRNQRTVRFLAFDPADGSATVLSEQRDECWVPLVPGLPARTASGALVAHADLRDTRHLTVDGVPVTPPGLQVRAVLGVDGEEVLFAASQEPTETHLWIYRPDGIQRISAEPGVHSGVRHDGTTVHVARCTDQPGGRVEVLREGNPATPIASLAERPAPGLHATRLVLGPRELRAVLYRLSSGTPPAHVRMFGCHLARVPSILAALPGGA